MVKRSPSLDIQIRNDWALALIRCETCRGLLGDGWPLEGPYLRAAHELHVAHELCDELRPQAPTYFERLTDKPFKAVEA